MRMELHGSGWYVKISLGIKNTKNINVCTPVCMFFNNPRLLQKLAVRRIAKYLAGTPRHVNLPDGNRRLSTRNVVYKPYKEK